MDYAFREQRANVREGEDWSIFNMFKTAYYYPLFKGYSVIILTILLLFRQRVAFAVTGFLPANMLALSALMPLAMSVADCSGDNKYFISSFDV